MKLSHFSAILLAIVLFSCSNDDPQPLTSKTVSIVDGDATVVEIPAGLASNTDSYAQQVTEYIQQVNEITEFTALMKPPPGAKKSSKITAANGRTSETTDTYTWSDDDGNQAAYQVTDKGDLYLFEFMIKLAGSNDWLRYIKAEERKDKSLGFLIVYDIFGFIGDDPSVELVKYEWTKSGDDFTFKMSNGIIDYYFILKTNTKTQAGSLDYFWEGVKYMSFTWDGDGNGTWVLYDEDGVTVIESGEW